MHEKQHFYLQGMTKHTAHVTSARARSGKVQRERGREESVNHQSKLLPLG